MGKEGSGRYGRIARRASRVAALGLAGISFAVPVVAAQEPAQGTAAPGESITTTVADVACPWPVVPPGVSYTRTPADCAEIGPFEFELSVGPSATAADHTISFFECAGADPPNCSPTTQAFALTVVEALPTSTPSTTNPTIPKIVPALAPATPDEKILNSWLEGLRKEIEDEGLVDDALDDLPELREGEEYTVRFTVPARLVGRVAENTLGDDRSATQTTIETLLSGKDLGIDKRTPAVQDADPGVDARWEWDVAADRSGEGSLTLSVTMTSTLRGTTWSKRFSEPPTDFVIRASWPYKIQRFFGGSWQWLLGLLIPLGVGYFTGRKTSPAKRHQGGPQTTEPPATA